MKFALFFLGEYVNALAVSFMFATLFLGGYNGPIFPPYVWLLIKAAVIFTILMWLRGTLPRIRVDQMHTMNWKFFVPISALNLIIVLLVAKIFQPGNPAMPWVTPPIQAMATAVTTLIPFLVGLGIASRRMRRPPSWPARCSGNTSCCRMPSRCWTTSPSRWPARPAC